MFPSLQEIHQFPFRDTIMLPFPLFRDLFVNTAALEEAR